MAANYWDSSQAKHWLFTHEELASMREKMRIKSSGLHAKYELPERRHMAIFMQQQMIKLARRLNLRQQVIATSQVYLSRFYLLVELRRTNPYLVMTTALYLAAKMEECPIHIRFVLSEAARHWPEIGHGNLSAATTTTVPSSSSNAASSSGAGAGGATSGGMLLGSSSAAGLLSTTANLGAANDTSRIGECEFHLISTLSAQMIVHHPYRTITSDLVPRLALTAEEAGLAASVVNDSYAADCLLLYAPHVVAVTAVFLALVLRPSGQLGAGLQAHAVSATVQQGLGIMTGALGGAAGNGGSSSSAGGVGGAALAGGMLGTKGHHAKVMRLVDWMAATQIDITAVIYCVQDIVSLYQVWDSYSERPCKEAISKFLRDLP